MNEKNTGNATEIGQVWTIRLPWTKPPLSLNDRMHWHKKARETMLIKSAVMTLCQAERVRTCQSIHVELHYVPSSNRRRDADNLVATLKPCIDALVSAGIVKDDSPEYVTWAMPAIHSADPKDPHLYLVIIGKA